MTLLAFLFAVGRRGDGDSPSQFPWVWVGGFYLILIVCVWWWLTTFAGGLR